MRTEAEIAEAKDKWYSAAYSSTVVAGVFVAVTAAVLFVSYLQIKVVVPLREERLEAMKLRIVETPNDEKLLGDIRQLDLEVRRSRTRHHVLVARSGVLILCGLVVFVVCIKITVNLSRKLPYPQGHPDTHKEQIQQASFARWATAGGLGVIGLFVLILAIRPVTDFNQTEAIAPPFASAEEIAANWPCFRGPGGVGVSKFANIPTTVDGVLWKTEVPGKGFSSPIVWGDKVFLSSGDTEKLDVSCFDIATGRMLWDGDVPSTALDKVTYQADTGFAASTMATDGRRVYAIFATGDIAAFNFAGEHLWAFSLGVPDSTYGYATSLIMYKNTLIVQYDHGGTGDDLSRLIAIDGFSGRTIWETKRPVPGSWTSPIIVETGKGLQLITCADPWIISYNPVDGKEIWRADCLGTDPAPSAVFADEMIFAVHPYSKLVAVKTDGTGDVTKTHIAWTADEGIPDICSPLADGKRVYMLTSDGYLTCYGVADGKMVFDKDIELSFFASPSLVADKVYLLDEDGELIVFTSGDEYKEVARSKLGEKCYASPAFVDGRIFIRAEKNLYCIGNKVSD